VFSFNLVVFPVSFPKSGVTYHTNSISFLHFELGGVVAERLWEFHTVDFVWISSPHFNVGVSSLQVAAHRKPVLTLLHMRDILARMMWRRPTPTLTSLQCGTTSATTSRRRNDGSGGMRRSILATCFRSADTFYWNELPSPFKDQQLKEYFHTRAVVQINPFLRFS
jgi:hypothetical protein